MNDKISIRDILSQIPAGASAAATAFYTAYLSQRGTIYDIRYASKEHLLECEYVVLKKNAEDDYGKYSTGGREKGYDNLLRLLKENNYELLTEQTNGVVIYKKP